MATALTEQAIIESVLVAQRDLYLRKGDRIVFIVDSSQKIGKGRLCKIFGNFDIAYFPVPEIENPGQDYPLDLEHLDGYNVAWLLTGVSASHAPTTRKLLEKGMFLISNPGITPDWPAILAPQNREACQANAGRLVNAIGGDVGGKFFITHEDGTNLTLEVPAKNWIHEVGMREGFGTNGPYGELATAPFNAHGTLVLQPGDFLTNPINRVNSKVVLTIKNNHVQKIEGELEARMLKKMLDGVPRPALAHCLGEFAFGLNPGRPEKLYRSVIAEKLLGGIHVALGTNSILLQKSCPEKDNREKFLYGRYDAGVHIDCIKFHPTVSYVGDGRSFTLLKNGELVI